MNKIVTPLLAAALALLPAAANAASPLEGLWRNPKGSVVVRIAPCGQQLCGRVVQANSKARSKAAEGGTDHLVGTTLLSNITPIGANRWKGRVFLPKQNTHATGNLRLAGRQLTVQGCLLLVVCKDQTWVKVS
ncbi:DUF2147 domain-containing protein [Sphingomonas sp. BN140010]|uniref:DUF2147 domain-containing protein n=1 Tax=Sphingomonas arvum TaxID=2992113 RepID=A0ABT3JBM9_9SPHN|nr:DUF2147 domain-containing protein [Sphingomonas sp. BN140010]MCW3796210.1 DUF2147 domain-containing protein [Sphingomonas sp. BN140010]